MNQKSIQEAAKRLNKVKHAEQSGELEIVLYGYFFLEFSTLSAGRNK